MQNGRGLHEGSHFHYKNQKHKHSEIHPKCPWSQGVLITQRQTLCLPSPYTSKTPTNFFPGCPLPASSVTAHGCFVVLRVATHTAATIVGTPGMLRGLAALFGQDGQGVNPLLRPRRASQSDLNSIFFLRSLSHRFNFCKLELGLLQHFCMGTLK